MREGSFPKDITASQFGRLRDVIHEASGIQVDDDRLDALRISLLARGTRLGCPDLDDYLRVLATYARELDELLELVTINETSFFRFPQQFVALRSAVLPELAARAEGEGKGLRIWSAGCSTGEEAYSIAMALVDAGVAGLAGGAMVLGTDVSTRALEAARAAVYGRRGLVNVPEEVLARHFEQVGGGYQVSPRVTRLVEFRQHNLVSDLGPAGTAGTWDAIFCRNVTIYFRLDSTQRVIASFFDALVPGGYLFIGHSETLAPFETGFEMVEVDGVFLYRKPLEGAAPPASLPSAGRRAGAAPPASLSSAGPPARPDGRPSGASAGGTAPVALEEAHRCADAGDLDGAAVACERALEADPLLVGARYLLAVVRQRQGSAERALEEFRRTVYTDPDFALAHLSMANIHKAEHRWDAAARGYENTLAALARSPEGPWTAFLGGFRVELLVASCERSLAECRAAAGQERPLDR